MKVQSDRMAQVAPGRGAVARGRGGGQGKGSGSINGAGIDTRIRHGLGQGAHRPKPHQPTDGGGRQDRLGSEGESRWFLWIGDIIKGTRKKAIHNRSVELRLLG
jgi:hypothetical protein